MGSDVDLVHERDLMRDSVMVIMRIVGLRPAGVESGGIVEKENGVRIAVTVGREKDRITRAAVTVGSEIGRRCYSAMIVVGDSVVIVDTEE